MSMADQQDGTNVWQALDHWARQLIPWQRRILSLATRNGMLTAAQIDGVYQLFVSHSKLADPPPGEEIAIDVSGRSTTALTKALCLVRVDGLSGVNALLDGSALTFAPGLTVIYGRNGAGKTGFARLIANGCFSRHKPEILCNIYDTGASQEIAATFHVSIDGEIQVPVAYALDMEHAELRRISFFDTTVARLRVSETTAFEFKPSGFDVFPEMVRVCGEIGKRLNAEIGARTHDTDFSRSFIGVETEVSKAVAAISASADVAELRALGPYGPTEIARLAEIDTQLVALKAGSPKGALATLTQAHADIQTVLIKLQALKEAFSVEKVVSRNVLSKAAKDATDDATKLGINQFKRAFFNAIGSPEWQAFSKAAHALGHKESASYPGSGDRCLLCERPLDDDSRQHISALLAFVEGEVQLRVAAVAKELDAEIVGLQGLSVDPFPEGSRVREHVHRLDPSIVEVVTGACGMLKSAHQQAIEALHSRSQLAVVPDFAFLESAISTLNALQSRVASDKARLAKMDVTAAIAALELEHQELRHREVLMRLIPAIEKYVADAAWCRKAKFVKAELNPRHITEKEKELFSAIIGETYRQRLADECKRLDCAVPVQLRTAGQRGETVRSLQMKGGYHPESILSEGEQRAVALADFLTEVGLNPANAGIVLDDPVTSQDHQRKESIARRLVDESRTRQVVVFTHDLVFLNQLLQYADGQHIDYQSHWVDRDHEGRPGHVTLSDVPATSKAYDTTERARQFFSTAQSNSGRARHDAICSGMGALRRTIEETIAKKLFKDVVPRWNDRVIVTGLRKVAWDDGLAEELVTVYEDLSKYIEGHSHTDEATGAPPELEDFEKMIEWVDSLVKRARPDKKAAAKVASA
jgi:energy-coupling factor transporter ATP-binding protein EcfA2